MNVPLHRVQSRFSAALALAIYFSVGRACWSAVTTAPADPVAAVGKALPHDPADVTGQFENGLHYLIRKNANPPGKVYMDLAVRSGSLNETDEQNGLAHFLEHMAFKGSTHFAPTRLIPMLTHLGMRFGADTNAHTNTFETVFKLSMPDTKPETIDLAFTIFSDYASGLSLFPIQIESERRVILEELRSRINVQTRERKQLFSQLFPGTPVAIHDVLGDPEIIKNAKEPLFRNYWNLWYRPENMTLVVVGDIDPDVVIARAKPPLGSFTARAASQTPVKAGLKRFDAPKVIVMSDPEQIAGSCQLLSIQPVRPAISTAGRFRQQLVESMGMAIVNRRLSDRVQTGSASFTAARVTGEDVLRDGYMISAGVEGKPKEWKKTLEELIMEVNRAMVFGFSEREFNIVRDSILSSAQRAIKTESTQDSAGLVSALSTAVDTDTPLISRQQNYDLLEKLLAGITVSDLQQSFSSNFGTKNFAYVLILPPAGNDAPLPTNEEVLATANQAWEKQASKIADVTQGTSSLPSESAPGTVVTRNFDSDLKITTATFQNGVVMHHRFSDYKKDDIIIQVVLPGGTLEETADNAGISAIASLMLERPATSRLTSLQIRDLFDAKNVSVRGGIGVDSLTVNVAGSPRDIPLGLQLLNAILTDGKLEQPAVDEWKAAALRALQGRPMLAEPQLADAIASTVMGGDPRFAATTPQIVERQQRDLAQAWFKHIAEHSAIEVSVVGDISADEAVALIATHLGSLPARTGKFSDLDSLRHISRKPGPYAQTVHYLGVEPKALAMGGFIGCDELDPQRRPLTLASLTLTDRLLQHLRFEKQLVYSIGFQSSPSHGLPGTGMLTASAPTDPSHAELVADMIDSIIEEFAKQGPTEDELASAKKQIVNQLASQMKDPSFWLVQLAELQYHHRSLDDLKQLPDVYQTFSTTQVRDAVRQYAMETGKIRMVVLPNQPATAPATVR